MESPFRRPLPDDLTLIETFGRRDGGFVRLADHLARLERSAAALGVPLRPGGDRPGARRRAPATEPLRVRLTLARDGAVAVDGGAARARARRSGGWRSPASGSTRTTRGCG